MKRLTLALVLLCATQAQAYTQPELNQLRKITRILDSRLKQINTELKITDGFDYVGVVVPIYSRLEMDPDTTALIVRVLRAALTEDSCDPTN